MKKNLFITLFCVVSIGLSAQQIQKLTFTDISLSGRSHGTVTVDAVFVGWTQAQISIENGFQVFYERENVNNEWHPWTFKGRQPAIFATTRQFYDNYLHEYNKDSRAAVRLNFQDGFQVVKIMTIPKGRASPLWWSEDGLSFYVLYEAWLIVP